MKKPPDIIEVAVGQLQRKESEVFSMKEKNRELAAYKMEMPVSCGVCTEISKVGNLWTNQKRHRGNIEKVV